MFNCHGNLFHRNRFTNISGNKFRTFLNVLFSRDIMANDCAYSFGKMKFNWRMIFHTSMDSSTWYSPWEPCISQCYSSVGTYIAQLKSKNLYITIPLLLIIPSKSLILSELIYLCKCNRWSIDVGWASTWVKIVNEWFAATIYCKWVNILAIHSSWENR